jgi:hypothetical protein
VTEASNAPVLVAVGWDVALVDGVPTLVDGVPPSSSEAAGVVLVTCCAAGVTVASGVLVPQAASVAVSPRLLTRSRVVRRRFVVFVFIFGSSSSSGPAGPLRPQCDKGAEATLKPTLLGFSRPSGHA